MQYSIGKIEISYPLKQHNRRGYPTELGQSFYIKFIKKLLPANLIGIEPDWHGREFWEDVPGIGRIRCIKAILISLEEGEEFKPYKESDLRKIDLKDI